ncbi:MAG: hypothetical protein J0L92_19105 [Deltaproteobacteria bacterium]|nr:hypothetical protein [Deltaproteobacteria bacterium]
MKRLAITTAGFARKRAAVEKHIASWSKEECSSFDAAIGVAEADPIWSMPAIDSKRVTSLLAELEPILGCRLPSSLIRKGGYRDKADLSQSLTSTIEARCSDALALDSRPLAAAS